MPILNPHIAQFGALGGIERARFQRGEQRFVLRVLHTIHPSGATGEGLPWACGARPRLPCTLAAVAA